MDAVLGVENLSKQFASADGAVDVLTDVSFKLTSRETLALEGESGSGKSTLLHLVGGLDRPTAGRIRVGGIVLSDLGDTERAEVRRGQVGIIFQQFNLIPSLTVSDNIAFHAQLAGRHDASWADHVASRIGVADQLRKYPEALSGGQQQRVAIARTLAARPGLILADEPTGNLDEDTADRVLELMLETAQEVGSAVLMVTHSARQAARMQRRMRLSHGVLHAIAAKAARATSA
ncbi:MAG: ABC transporter ATP-binding protein [Pseudomonadota bacterium]